MHSYCVPSFLCQLSRHWGQRPHLEDWNQSQPGSYKLSARCESVSHLEIVMNQSGTLPIFPKRNAVGLRPNIEAFQSLFWWILSALIYVDQRLLSTHSYIVKDNYPFIIILPSCEIVCSVLLVTTKWLARVHKETGRNSDCVPKVMKDLTHTRTLPFRTETAIRAETATLISQHWPDCLQKDAVFKNTRPAIDCRIWYLGLGLNHNSDCKCTLSSQVAAWPSSSTAMTRQAAPWCFTICAWCLKASSPFSKGIELTIHLPWHAFRPVPTIWNCIR